MQQSIREVKDLESLITYFSSKLAWPITLDDYCDIEDITYTFDASYIGLKEEEFAKISSLKQLRPFVDDQQWGIFFVNFDSDRFEVSALRKILSHLVPARRNATHAVWDKKDLLFLCTWGEGNKTTVGAAHFEDTQDRLSQIQMFSCEPAVEDFTQINIFEQRLSKLIWPSDPNDTTGWHEAWTSAFTHRYRQTIHDARTLTISLAEEAQRIRDSIMGMLKVESDEGYVHLLSKKFRKNLILNMTDEQFADMYAQTVVYGLFSARCMCPSDEDFSSVDAIDRLPNTNPFLRDLMKDCLFSKRADGITFDELEVQSVVSLLRHTDTKAILEDFNRQTNEGREDPVLHFYEDFLNAYNKTQKVQHGVFFTPQPAVNFMVRAVDDILKSEFGMIEGLASQESKKIELPQSGHTSTSCRHKKIEVPAIQILDPATGTGTFLRQIILQIYHSFMLTQGHKTLQEKQEAWNDYVPRYLLRRLYAFELMMAPYAVAHMKLAMVLHDTGYDFSWNQRLNVFLTNSLEKAGNTEHLLFDDPLAQESIAANAAKKNGAINIVIGNPPYRGESANKNAWINELMKDYKKEPNCEEKLQETNIKWVNNDYVKFIRYAQTFISNSSEGIIAYINPHGFIDNPTFRGMRWYLLNSFSSIYILDLHGSAKKKERSPDGSIDQNIFDIQEGVCIWFGIRKKSKSKKKKETLARVYHAHLYGTRAHKYEQLNSMTMASINWQEVPMIAPSYNFFPQQVKDNQGFFEVKKLFPIHRNGICTKRDPIAYQRTREEMEAVIDDFYSLTEEELKIKYSVTSESRDQKVSYAMANVRNYGKRDEYFHTCLYAPFIHRWTYFTSYKKGFIADSGYKVLKHMLSDNLGLIISRQGQAADVGEWNVVFATDTLVNINVMCRGGSCLFPLYLITEEMGKSLRTPNLAPDIVANIAAAVGLPYMAETTTSSEHREVITPKDIFHYVYAVLHSNVYRRRYAEQLKLDFPWIPYPKGKDDFRNLAKLGKELVAIHLMRSDCSGCTSADVEEGADIVAQIRYENKERAIFISKRQKIAPVEPAVWEFKIGGNKVLKKWLEDKKGQKLSETSKKQFIRIIGAIKQTIEFMHLIDQELPQETQI